VRRIRWLGAPFVALALGCAAPQPAGKTVLAQSPSEAIVVLPLNVTGAMPKELEAASPRIWRELKLYLRAHGASLKTLSFPTARGLWIDSVREARAGAAVSKADFAEAARIFVAKVAPHAEFGALIIPSLFVQGAEISGWTASWDGVERPVLIDEGRWAGQFAEDTPFGGTLPAASIHAAVLDAQGELIQQSQSGLALLVSIRLAGRPGLGPPRFEIVDLPEPFDREPILEGIAQALAPFLSPLPAEAIPAEALPAEAPGGEG
jgi:hypothetical protein